MAKQIKVLKCPQCGNTRPTSIGKEHYRCDKCQTEFFLDSDDVNINVNHRIDHRTNRPPNVHKGLWITLGVVFFCFVVMFALLRAIVRHSKTASNSYTLSSTARTESGKYLFSMPVAVQGKGVALTIERKRTADTAYVAFRDIVTGEILSRQSLLEKNQAYTATTHRRFESEGADYLIVNKNRIYKFHPSGYRLTDFSAEMYTRKPALESGVMTAEFVPEGNGEGFKLHTNLGKELYYFPATDILCTEKAFRYLITDKPSENATESTYYLFLNKESAHSSNVAELLQIRYLFNAGGPENKLLEATPANLRNSASHRILAYKPITEERIYFSPAVLYSDTEQVLISYRPSLAPDAGTTIELLDSTDGKVIWKTPFTEELNTRFAIATATGFIVQTSEDTFISIDRNGQNVRTHKLP